METCDFSSFCTRASKASNAGCQGATAAAAVRPDAGGAALRACAATGQPVRTTSPRASYRTSTCATAVAVASTRMAAAACSGTRQVTHQGASAIRGTTTKPGSRSGGAHCVSWRRTPCSASNSSRQDAHPLRCASTRARSSASHSS